jgi:hypothetical protein
MSAENTITATPGAAPAAPVDVDKLQSENAMLVAQVKTLQDHITKLESRPRLGESFAQQLFLMNLTQVNDPNVTQAWERTEHQLKFLESKLG